MIRMVLFAAGLLLALPEAGAADTALLLDCRVFAPDAPEVPEAPDTTTGTAPDAAPDAAPDTTTDTAASPDKTPAGAAAGPLPNPLPGTPQGFAITLKRKGRIEVERPGGIVPGVAGSATGPFAWTAGTVLHTLTLKGLTAEGQTLVLWHRLDQAQDKVPPVGTLTTLLCEVS